MKHRVPNGRIATAFAFSLALLLQFAAPATAASAEKSRFDIPAEDLGKSLRDFAIQANCNLSYDPASVKHLQAPAIKGDYQAIETYQCPADRRIEAPITVLTGDADPKTTLDEANAWQQHTTGGFRVKVFPGGHFFLASQKVAVNAEIERELKAPVPLG